MAERIEVTTAMAAPADRIYDLVADVTRMGEWSPETTSCRWLGGASEAAVGARFKGTNQNGAKRWSTTCRVVAAERGKRFAFDVRAAGMPIARWAYDLAAEAGGGTNVTESFEDRRPGFVKPFGQLVSGIGERNEHNRTTMSETLRRLKAAAEAG